MKVLIACEESQTTMKAFRSLGHNAFSCDLQDCSGGMPQYHIKADCRDVIDNGNWDLIIAHPPCTYLSVAGACNLMNKDGTIKNFQRYEEMLKAREFFMYFYNLTGVRVCIENPRAMKLCQLPLYSQVIQPFQFGDDFSKQTLLWLKDLPYLIPSCYGTSKRKWVHSWVGEHYGSVQRSKSFPGIAKAMALQWSDL